MGAVVEYLRQRVRPIVNVYPEPSGIAGNVQATGDDMADRDAEREVAELSASTEWGWCKASVYGEFGGRGVATVVGRLSFNSRDEFLASPYYRDAVDDMLEKLARQLHGEFAALALAMVQDTLTRHDRLSPRTL